MAAHELTDQLFRRSAGRLVAHLTGALGAEHLGLAEDAVQHALLKALQGWPFQGIPANPEGWLFRVARNHALDELRHSSAWSRALALMEAEHATPPDAGPDQVADDQLAMIFLSCHPVLSEPMRVGLTLKIVAGFGVDEIAAAFLAPRAAIQQRLVRAKRILRESSAPFTLPADTELDARLNDVLSVIYLTFNEGYAASAGESPIRAELCTEAIRLARGLAAHPATDQPPVHALLSLMYLQASRLPARTDNLGALVLLEEQDRSLWDRRAIALGFHHLERAASGPELTAYHLEAGIASCHAMAPSVLETDWPRVLAYYDELLDLAPGPVVRLNRAVAVAMLRGPLAGLAELSGLERDPRMHGYHLLPAVRGYLLQRAGRATDARRAYAQATRLARTGAQRDLIRKRLDAVAT